MQLYKIKKDSPIIGFIGEEIAKYYNKPVGVCIPRIDDTPVCSNDLYGLHFNGNNNGVVCMNVTVFTEPKSADSPKIIGDDGGYDYYKYSSSCSIKLKTFLEKNPQWSNIKEWTTPVKVEQKMCKYNGHSTDTRTAAIKRPDGKDYIVDFPASEPNDRNLLTWIKPMEKELTKMYYRAKKLDKLKKIKRNLSVWVEGITFVYDYYNGDVVIFDICNRSGSIYSAMVKSKLITVEFGLPELTKEMVKKEIEGRDLEVKSITLGKYKSISNRIKVTF